MPTVNKITTTTRDAYRATISDYAGQGYSTVHTDPNSTTLSRKKAFNWVLAIICLFIPIIGWIALAMMLTAASRGSQVVEVSLVPASVAPQLA